MLLEILIAILIGCFLGIITGLTPGIHINLVAVILLSLTPLLSQYVSILTLAVAIITMSITHTFLDALPSIFLGAPDSGLELSVLPGHKLLLEGRGYEAVFLTVVGSFFAVVVCLLISPVMIPLIRYGYPIIEPYIAYILIFFSAVLIAKEVKSRFWALVVYLLSGTLGIATLTMPL